MQMALYSNIDRIVFLYRSLMTLGEGPVFEAADIARKRLSLLSTISLSYHLSELWLPCKSGIKFDS